MIGHAFFFVQHDNGLATLGALAGNVGLNQTAQQNFRDQLAANADYRAQSQQDFQQQQAQDSGDDSMYRTILGDVTQRQLSSDKLDNAITLKGMTTDEQTELEGLKEAARTGNIDQTGAQRLDYLTQKNQFLGGQGDANRAVKIYGIDTRAQSALDASDAANERGYSHDLARAQIEADKAQAKSDYVNARNDQQKQAAEDRYNRADQLSQIHAQIDLLKQQKRQAASVLLNNARARMKQVSPIDISNATAQYDQQIQQAIAQIKGAQRIMPQSAGPAAMPAMQPYPDQGGYQDATQPIDPQSSAQSPDGTAPTISPDQVAGLPPAPAQVAVSYQQAAIAQYPDQPQLARQVFEQSLAQAGFDPLKPLV